MKLTKEIKTAILVISGILLFIFIFYYLKGENILDDSKKITAVYDNVEGLATSAAVTINGHKIGKVQSIEFTDDRSGKLNVNMLIDSDFEFSKNSTAQLYEMINSSDATNNDMYFELDASAAELNSASAISNSAQLFSDNLAISISGVADATAPSLISAKRLSVLAHV